MFCQHTCHDTRCNELMKNSKNVGDKGSKEKKTEVKTIASSKEDRLGVVVLRYILFSIWRIRARFCSWELSGRDVLFKSLQSCSRWQYQSAREESFWTGRSSQKTLFSAQNGHFLCLGKQVTHTRGRDNLFSVHLDFTCSSISKILFQEQNELSEIDQPCQNEAFYFWHEWENKTGSECGILGPAWCGAATKNHAHSQLAADLWIFLLFLWQHQISFFLFSPSLSCSFEGWLLCF